MSMTTLFTFFAASFVLAITPGPTMSLVIANATSHGRRAGLLTVFGNLSGLAILLTAVVFGLSSIIAFMSEWFEVLRWLGAAYLIYLGARTLWKLRGEAPSTAADTKSNRWYWQGFFVALSNPKVLLFLGAFLPQFLDPGAPAFGQLITLAAIFLATLAAVDCLYALAVAQARAALSGPWRRVMGGYDWRASDRWGIVDRDRETGLARHAGALSAMQSRREHLACAHVRAMAVPIETPSLIHVQ